MMELILLTLDTPVANITEYLRLRGLIDMDDRVTNLSKPGEGNMNVVIRAKTQKNTFILKQSRPFVQKYPQIPAPIERIEAEYSFFKTLATSPISHAFPKILSFDPKNHLIVFEDLGELQDIGQIYATRKVPKASIDELVAILTEIHSVDVPEGYPKNLELRQLNHQHIFVLPFMEENGFQLNDIQPGLQELALHYKKDNALTAKIHALGELYLSHGTTLLHGDFYPGSWMRSKGKVYVLDPEFTFAGFPEFDLGVMAAHLILATGEQDWLQHLFEKYGRAIGSELYTQIAGVEIMRRLIGLAQLPLQRSLDEKERLLKMAHKMVLS